jgi:Histidine kinase-, DNA gyrase B-, and HSP90-like ATPase
MASVVSHSSQRQPRADSNVGGTVELHYVARAGLLPELGRQTYDSLYKALREAVLNAVDARASRVDLDFSQIAARREIIVRDDGGGMSTREFCEQFMSLGGSSKFGAGDQFGRIGIGSLALLQYGSTAIVETKRAGTQTATRAVIQHPWTMARAERRVHLGDLHAGVAEEYSYDGDPADHFTHVRIQDVNADVSAVGQDPTKFYTLVDELRRALPLPAKDTLLNRTLRAADPRLMELLDDHIAAWSAPVYAHSPWERDIQLVRRSYGDDQAGVEEWSGLPRPIRKVVRVTTESGSRKVTVAGYLLSQKRALTGWSGVCARVQNVAVEAHTFFDVTTDPGFRKYITGEIWLLGEVDRERLINIDRSSFSRECADYRAIQRYMSRAIIDFKAASVQRPQRLKVQVRQHLERQRQALAGIASVARCAEGMLNGAYPDLPSSEPNRRPGHTECGLEHVLDQIGAEVVVAPAETRLRDGYRLSVSDDGQRIRAEIDAEFLSPRVAVGPRDYTVAFVSAGPQGPPVWIRKRPRQIVFNVQNPAHAGNDGHRKYGLSLALELAYLLEGDGDATGVYERLMTFVEVL